MFHLRSWLYKLTLPQSLDEEKARQEHILNILLLGTIFLAAIAFGCSGLTFLLALYEGHAYLGVPPVLLAVVAVFFAFQLWLSKKGRSRLAAYLMISFYVFAGLYTSLTWGADVPQALLVFALAIIMSGILLGTRTAIFFTLLISSCLLFLTYAHAHALLPYRSSWKELDVTLPDTLVTGVTFLLIALISWLYNREISASLRKAAQSKSELKQERDSLEMKVEERTRQLREMQLEKMMQLYRFAEFGRIAAGLFHDLGTPLTSMNFNLEFLERQLGTKKKTTKLTESMKTARQNVLRIEEFVGAARQQLQKQDHQEFFALEKEIRYVCQVLNYKARRLHVHLQVMPNSEKITLYGNSLKMTQVLTNLISNAIDSYQNFRPPGIAKVIIRTQQTPHLVKVLIQDWGCGIPVEIQSQIFQPLFTTKAKDEGMGIGLSISKEIVEKDFKGKIRFRSREQKGSLFTFVLPTPKKKVS